MLTTLFFASFIAGAVTEYKWHWFDRFAKYLAGDCN